MTGRNPKATERNRQKRLFGSHLARQIYEGPRKCIALRFASSYNSLSHSQHIQSDMWDNRSIWLNSLDSRQCDMLYPCDGMALTLTIVMVMGTATAGSLGFIANGGCWALCLILGAILKCRPLRSQQAPVKQGPAPHAPKQNGEDGHRKRRGQMRAAKREVEELTGAWSGSLPVGLAVIAFSLLAAVGARLEFRTNGFSLTLSLIIYMVSNLQMLVRSIAYHDGAHDLLHSDTKWNYRPLVNGI